MGEIYIFSEENLLAQIEKSEYKNGYYAVKFYTVEGKIADTVTNELSNYYLYPSGGTLRDKDFNIVFYSSKFDTYRGFLPPHKRNTAKS